MEHEKYMREAIRIATENVKVGGGPFGAVIVRKGAIISTAVNEVVKNNDPTAHAEISAIRKACKALATFNLEGAQIYTSCEPCPMCLAAIYWARIDKVYYGNNTVEANSIGFDDSFIYEELKKPSEKRKIDFIELLPEEAIKSFKAWDSSNNKQTY